MRAPGRGGSLRRGFRRQSDHDVDVNLRYDPVVRPERLQQQVTRVRQHQRGVQLLEQVGGYELRHLIGESVPSDAQIAQRGNRLHLNLGLPHEREPQPVPRRRGDPEPHRPRQTPQPHPKRHGHVDEFFRHRAYELGRVVLREGLKLGESLRVGARVRTRLRTVSSDFFVAAVAAAGVCAVGVRVGTVTVVGVGDARSFLFAHHLGVDVEVDVGSKHDLGCSGKVHLQLHRGARPAVRQRAPVPRRRGRCVGGGRRVGQPRGSNLRDVLPEVNPGDGNRADKLWKIRDALAELRKVPAHLRDLLRRALHVEDDAREHAVERGGGGAARAPANLARGTPRPRPAPLVLAVSPRASIERRESLVVNLFGRLAAVLDRDARAQVVDERALRLVAVAAPVAVAVAIPRAVAADPAPAGSRADAPGPLREPRRRPRRGEHRRVHHGPRARDILPQRHRPRLFRGVAEGVAPHHPVTLVQRALGVREDDWQALPPALLLPRADRPSPGSVPGDAVLRP